MEEGAEEKEMVVTGDRYLECLVKFVDSHAWALLHPRSEDCDGGGSAASLTLKLNPVGLHYVQSRLDALREVEGLLSTAPVDYLRAYVSDLGDHRAVEQLRRILRLLPSLKVISLLRPPLRDPTPLSLSSFASLRVLELRGCDLSTSEARGLLHLTHCLEKLICHNSTDALRHVFASRVVDIKDSLVWKRLSFVSCACNNLLLMDESLRLLPVVETLDLSRNRFTKTDNLKKCGKLQHLDLGFNHLRTVASLGKVSGPITKLILRNNALTSLRGIENLKSIKDIDVSYNIISKFSELEVLSSLPCLKSLWLEGNPVSCARWYRAQVFSLFLQTEKLELDGKGICTREFWEMRAIIARRQKRPMSYGFYLPAKDADEDNKLPTKMKKPFRLASINEEQRLLDFDGLCKEPTSCSSEHLKTDEHCISNNESEIINLMGRIEEMKKKQSACWLQEFMEWLGDEAPEKSAHASMQNKAEFIHTGCSYAGECSKQDQTSVQELSGKEYIGLENSTADVSHCATSDKCGHNHGKRKSEPSTLNSKFSNAKSASMASALNIYEHGDCSGELNVATQNPRDVESKGFLPPLAATKNVNGLSDSPLRSPPHYTDDILRVCRNSEDVLHLSTESCSVASSECDTSYSGDDLTTRFITGSNTLDEDSSSQSTNSDSVNSHENDFDEEESLNIGEELEDGHLPRVCLKIMPLTS